MRSRTLLRTVRGMHDLNGFQFSPPPGYRVDEVMSSWRSPSTSAGSASFIAQSKKARLGASLEELTTETVLELTQSLGNGLKDMSKAEFGFDDGGTGMLLGFTLNTSTGTFRQYFALRLQGDRLCTLTVTASAASLDQAQANALLTSIASLRVA